MKKEKIYQLLYIISLLLIVGFGIIITVDYIQYSDITNSAPFYAFIIERSVEFLLPAIILFILALVVKKKWTKS